MPIAAAFDADRHRRFTLAKALKSYRGLSEADVDKLFSISDDHDRVELIIELEAEFDIVIEDESQEDGGDRAK